MNRPVRTWQMLLVGFVVITSPCVLKAQDKTDWSSLDQYVNSSMKDWKVPGASIAIVRDGAVVYMKGFGVRDIRTN
ncbi:MAG TPA: serine hydrolase, partial [Blastocatellia bacterium]|nr:serine hydrolase [Blastocatellia bacterium]